METTPHKRRARYNGKNPRQFHEKYKEHSPERYQETYQKVLESGKTPAGSHRSIMLVEVMEVLSPKPGEIAVDATLGYGGHAREILQRILPGGKLIGLDTDPLELPKAESRLRSLAIPSEALWVFRTNYAALPKILADQQIKGVDVVLADLGCSSMQLDNPARGFSFKSDGPLDLRMNPNKGRSGANILASLNEKQLTQILQENSDEPHAAILAKAILDAQKYSPIQTTARLAEVVRKAQSSLDREDDTVVRRVFQALRIAVNEEFTALETFLRVLPDCLNSKGRVAILSFHSGEDRRVKKAFESGKGLGIYSKISEEVMRSTPDEIRSNPRASSAKLRWAIRV